MVRQKPEQGVDEEQEAPNQDGFVHLQLLDRKHVAAPYAYSLDLYTFVFLFPAALTAAYVLISRRPLPEPWALPRASSRASSAAHSEPTRPRSCEA